MNRGSSSGIRESRGTTRRRAKVEKPRRPGSNGTRIAKATKLQASRRGAARTTGQRPALESDVETRERLLESAARLFASDGYAKVTVRDICTAAGANVAAINYHFGGKTGLYEQVLRRAIAVMQETTREAMAAGEGKHPREQLRVYLSIFMRRVLAGRDSWIHQMMMRELADPTPALDLVVDEVMKPRMEYLSKIIGALLEARPSDTRVRLCAIGVQAQCLAVLRSGFSDRLDIIRVDEHMIGDVAEHIARFSLGGIRAVAGS